MRDFNGDIQGQKVPVEGGGRCIYCGADGGADGLRDEHIIPYSLGGNTESLAASCSACERITSYLDGYLANAIYKHVRVHSDIQSRSGHPDLLPAIVEINGDERAFELSPQQHPYFLHMPIWNPPGVMCGSRQHRISARRRCTSIGMYRRTFGNRLDCVRVTWLKSWIVHHAELFNVRAGNRKGSLLSRCLMLGLGGFRPFALPGIILGRYPNIPYFVGSDLGGPPPPEPRQILHQFNARTLHIDAGVSSPFASGFSLKVALRQTVCPFTRLSLVLRDGAFFPLARRRFCPR